MKKKKSEPFVVVKRSNVSVNIYRVMKKGYQSFVVDDRSNGKRKLIWRADLKDAKAEAELVANKISQGKAAVLQLEPKARDAYVRAMENLKKPGSTTGEVIAPIEIATLHYAEAVKILGSDNILEAARYFVKKHPVKLPQVNVKTVVDELIDAKKSANRGDRYLSDLRYRLGSFAEKFPTTISNVTAPEIQKFLDGLKLSPVSYINFRRVIGTLFRFAKRRGYLARDNDEIENLEKVDRDDGEITTYTPDEMTRLLQAAAKDFVPVLAIGGFAGLRSSEIERLDWSDIDLGQHFITVKGARKRGTPSRRIVPIADNLAAWLKPYAKKSGKVWTGSHDDFYDAQQETAAATKTKDLDALEWKHNALRHSFISYRLAEVQNDNQVALEAGNSAATIHTHYKGLVTPNAAKAWFSIVP